MLDPETSDLFQVQEGFLDKKVECLSTEEYLLVSNTNGDDMDTNSHFSQMNFPKNFNNLETENILEHEQTKEAIILETHIKQWGYPFERYSVQTKSGWVIEMHRIKHGKNEISSSNPDQPRPVVMLQHGVLNSSAAWVVTGPKYSLALKLADAGFDVWLGNNRGTQFARKHKRFTYKDQQFWNWTFQHMGLEDLPTQINYVLDLTGQKKLTYIGHSQGTTQAFVGFSLMEELQEKINLFIGLAPVTSMKNQRNHALKLLANLKTETLFQWLEVGEFGHRSLSSNILPGIASSFKYKVMTKLNSLWGIVMDCNLDTECLNLLTTLEPSPTSVTNLAHWAFLVRSGRFCKRDMGKTLNSQIYSPDGVPPDYPIEKIQLPVALFYADLDLLSTPKDVEEFLIPKLSHLIYFERYSEFKHNDFVWGKSTRSLHEKIIDLIRVYSLNDNDILGRETILAPHNLSSSSIENMDVFQKSIQEDGSLDHNRIESLVHEIEEIGIHKAEEVISENLRQSQKLPKESIQLDENEIEYKSIHININEIKNTNNIINITNNTNNDTDNNSNIQDQATYNEAVRLLHINQTSEVDSFSTEKLENNEDPTSELKDISSEAEDSEDPSIRKEISDWVLKQLDSFSNSW